MLSIIIHQDYDILIDNNIYPSIAVKVIEHEFSEIGNCTEKRNTNLGICSFPEIQKLFKKHTRNTKFQAGDLFIGEIKGFSPGIIYIATQPDMYHAELTYLNKGLKRLKKVCESRGIKTVSLPKIGAGLGKLDWNSEVKPLLESILSDCETVFNVYEDYKIEYEI